MGSDIVHDVVFIVFIALAICICIVLLSWVYAARCMALVPVRGFIAPCTVVNIYRFFYGPFMTLRLEFYLVSSIFRFAERDGYLISIDNGCPNCPRAYCRVPPPVQLTLPESSDPRFFMPPS